jgi:hypothetical protein
MSIWGIILHSAAFVPHSGGMGKTQTGFAPLHAPHFVIPAEAGIQERTVGCAPIVMSIIPLPPILWVD